MFDALLGALVIGIAIDAALLRWRWSIALLVWANTHFARYRAALVRTAGSPFSFALWSGLTFVLLGVWHYAAIHSDAAAPLPRSAAALRDLLIVLIATMAFWPNQRWRRRTD